MTSYFLKMPYVSYYIKVWALLVLLFITVVVGIGASVGNAAPVRTPPTTLPDVEVIFGSSTNIIVEANSDHAFNEGNQKNNIQSWDFVVPPK